MADETIYLVAASLQGDEELADQTGGDAPSPKRPDAQSDDEPPPLRAFLRSITVEGFRGIGPRASLELNPYCGITVISGSNGSGKSSFAEALEYALTGTSYRWTNKRASIGRPRDGICTRANRPRSPSTSRCSRTMSAADPPYTSASSGMREQNSATPDAGRR